MNSLVYNGTKTKAIIFPTWQMRSILSSRQADTYSVVLNGNEAENKMERQYGYSMGRTCQCYKVLIWYVAITEIILKIYHIQPEKNSRNIDIVENWLW